jgi:dTDP-4-dehydrorhamnose 3,5-epimerase
VNFRPAGLEGAFLIDITPAEDERGFFARSWCAREAAVHGIDPDVVQCNISFNRKRGTLRGMHYQAHPCEEAKLVRCTRGSIHDVIVDLRDASPTRARHVAVVLSAERRDAIFVPAGFAHGFLTLEDDTEVSYQMSAYHSPEHARGFRWNDPTFAIPWPMEPKVISARDREYVDFSFEGGAGRP